MNEMYGSISGMNEMTRDGDDAFPQATTTTNEAERNRCMHESQQKIWCCFWCFCGNRKFRRTSGRLYEKPLTFFGRFTLAIEKLSSHKKQSIHHDESLVRATTTQMHAFMQTSIIKF
mmetsp:Transcript_8156/g.23448  ORF Transcript_8156/g.23448 Transcript_8156/m.23448 type:complete len:117 (-) Transcript_8156:2338-2688(-)